MDEQETFGPPLPLEDLPVGQRLHLLGCPPPADARMAWSTDVIMDPLLGAVEEANRTSAILISPVHFVIKAVECTVSRFPEFNVRVFRGRVRPYLDHRLILPCQTREKEARVILLEGLEKKSVPDIAEEMWEKLMDPEESGRAIGRLEKVGPLARHIGVRPLGAFSRFFMRVLDHRALRLLGLEPNPGAPVLLNYFGSADFPPLGSYTSSRLPAEFPATSVTLGRPTEKPVAIGGKVVVRRVSTTTVRGDHSFVDGHQLGRFVQDLKKRLENPSSLLK